MRIPVRNARFLRFFTSENCLEFNNIYVYARAKTGNGKKWLVYRGKMRANGEKRQLKGLIWLENGFCVYYTISTMGNHGEDLLQAKGYDIIITVPKVSAVARLEPWGGFDYGLRIYCKI